MNSKIKRFHIYILLILFLGLLLGGQVRAETVRDDFDIREAVVEKISTEVLEDGSKQIIAELTLDTGESITVTDRTQLSADRSYKEGDRVLVQATDDMGGFVIVDHKRTGFLTVLGLIFVALTVLIVGKRGALSLASTGFSFVLIYFFVLPQIINGRNPVLMALAVSVVIIPISFYLAHGFSRKTHIAIFSTFLTLILAVSMSALSVRMANLTGFSSDEAMFLQISKGSINMSGLLLAGIIIGFLGILDDITISQSAIIEQLKKANPNLSSLELYNKGMSVGRDHITSMINTLVLVYTGASLPLLLLLSYSGQPFGYAMNTEMIAEEVVRTLLGSIGLVLAVPLTTFLAATFAESNGRIRPK